MHIGAKLGTLVLFAAQCLALYLALTWDLASTPPAPLAALTTVELNGQLHYATIRSRMAGEALRDAPILLMLHGGPGATSIPSLHLTDRLLEEHFVVVNYDQRSAGKSCRFHDFSSAEPLTIGQHVEDALDMVQYLRRRFGRDKIYLLGGSWGTKLALLLARDHPILFEHVAVRGLAVDSLSSERLSNAFIQKRFPEFEPKGPPYGDRFKDLREQRSFLYRAGGMVHRCSLKKCSKFDLTLHVAKTVLASKEMSWSDIFRYQRCYMTTLERLWPEVEALNITKEITALEVPLLVLHGRHDYNTAHELVPRFFDALKAPMGKRLVWFEHSAHSPQTEEPTRFQETVIKEFLGSKVR